MGRRAISLAPEREEGKVLNKNTPQRIYIISILKSASNLNGNLNCSKELEHYAS